MRRMSSRSLYRKTHVSTKIKRKSKNTRRTRTSLVIPRDASEIIDLLLDEGEKGNVDSEGDKRDEGREEGEE